MADSPFIVDVTRENYQQVMETSFKVPVLLDFWASWCQPCHMLMPTLAKLAEEYEGRFILGKLNTEEEQEIAAQFGIRSIPNVKLFRDGLPVDEFMGALPESAVREFLERHVARESDTTVIEAREQMLSGNVDAAIARLTEAREADPDNPRITLALAEALATGGDVAAAEAILDGLPANEQVRPEVTLLKNQLYFTGKAAGAPETAELESRLETHPDDHEARLQLAMRKVTEKDYDTAMELLLELMRKDRSWGDDAGRNALLKVFELLGDDPRVGQYRRRMASLLH